MSPVARIIWWGMAATAILLLALALNVPIAAYGHDHSRPDLDSWFGGLRSKAGSPCCGGPKVDATVLEDTDWEVRNGHYRARIEGEWVDVPDDAVVDEPNRAGRTLVWPYHQDGKPRIRCFMPGAMI